MRKLFTILFFLFASIAINAQVWSFLQESGAPQDTYTQNDFMTTDIYFALNVDTSPYTVEFGIGPSNNDGTGWTWYAAAWSHQDGNNRYWKFTDDATVQFTTTGQWYYAARFVGGSTYYADGGWEGDNVVLNTVAYFQVDAALPVELSSFTAIVAQNEVQLNWKTATEVNNYGFEVQKSNDNQNFETLAFVEGHGNSNSVKSYSYADNKVADGKYYYRLKQINSDGTFEYSETISAVVGMAEAYSLLQNYPNPFNPTTTIQFNLPENSVVSLKVFNALGQQVADLANGLFEAGNHKINFNASELNSGIYFYQIKTNNFTQVRKMMLVK